MDSCVATPRLVLLGGCKAWSWRWRWRTEEEDCEQDILGFIAKFDGETAFYRTSLHPLPEAKSISETRCEFSMHNDDAHHESP